MREEVMHSTEGTPRARSRRRLPPIRLVLFALGIILVLWFVRRVGYHSVATQLMRVGPWALLLLVPYGIGTAVGALPWGRLLSRQVRPRFGGLVLSRFAASSANALLPLFGVAGEPSRLLWLPARARAQGLAAIVVDRLLYNASNGVVLLGGAATAAYATRLPDTWVMMAVGMSAVMLAVSGGLVWMVTRAGIGRRIHSLLGKLFRGLYAREDFGRAVDSSLLELLRGPRARLFSSLGLHVAGRSLLALEVFLGLALLGTEVSIAQGIVLAVVPIALSVFFSSVPSQIGIQEGAQTLVASALGLDPAAVLALVLLQRFRQLVYASLMPFILGSARAKST
jgi:hypothetical protein